MTLESERDRGERAARLLADQLFNEAFDTVDAALRAAWEATADSQERERERLWLMVKLLGRVKGHLVEAMETGKVACIQIDEAEARARRERERRA